MKRSLAALLLALLLPATAGAQLVPSTVALSLAPRDGLSEAGSSLVADDPDAVLWFAAVGTVGLEQRNRVNTLFAALKAAGSYAKADDYWLLVAENSTQALTSLKQRRLGVAINAPVFAAGLGYTFDGVASYIDTGFVQSTMATVSTGDNLRLGVYFRAPDGVPNTTYAAGARNSATRVLRITPRATAPFLIDTNDNGALFTRPGTTSKGYNVGSRSDTVPANKRGYYNGVPMPLTTVATSFGSALPSFSMHIGGQNTSGTAQSFAPCTLGFLAVGASLTDPQELAEYQAIQAYMVAWGAGV